MAILSISTDKKIFDSHSASARRQVAYARAHGMQTHIIVFTTKKQKLATTQLPEQVTVYPTQSRNKVMAIFDAILIGRKIKEIGVVTTQDPFFTGFAGMKLAYMHKTKLHVQVHTDMCAYSFARGLLNKVRLVLARIVLPRASCVRVVSESIKDSISKKYKITAPVEVLPIFVDTKHFSDASAPEHLKERYATYSTKLLVVSRLAKEKNVALAIDSFAKVVQKHKDVCLIILGEGEEKAKLQAQVQNLGVEEHVYFEGFAEPAEYYALADITLVPSLYEGYGLVIIESLASGTPVLATNVGVAKESGAHITTQKDFAETLSEMINTVPEASLQSYPYKNEQDYIAKYAQNITACV